MKTLGLAAACAAFALTATSAMAGGYWQNGTYYSYPTAQTTTTYTAPAATVTGSVGPIQSAGTVTYLPSTTYTAPTYVAPASTTTYVAPATTYTTPSYIAPAPAYVAPGPAYTAPRYDGRDRVRQRLRNQRNRIENASARGELRRGEERRLRENLRDIRATFRDYRDNDGVIGQYEEAQLMRMLDRNSRRIFRLAHNDRVAGGYRAYPY